MMIAKLGPENGRQWTITPTRRIEMPKPTFADGIDFIPMAMATSEFKSKGIVFGTDPSRNKCHWVVIDPQKQVMRVWKKGVQDYIVAAGALGASVVSNGPYIRYGSPKEPVGSAGKITSIYLNKRTRTDGLNGNLLYKLMTKLPGMENLPQAMGNLDRYLRLENLLDAPLVPAAEKMRDRLSDSAPTGAIKGKLITDVNPNSAAGYYFGRSGDSYGDYKIALGRPGLQSEAIGGLVSSVANYQVKKFDAANTYCHWGLVPLGNGSRVLAKTKHKTAVRNFAYPKSQSLSDAVAGGSGVIFGVAYGGKCLDATLPKLGVEHAVRVDGSDSVVFGEGKKLHWGNQMITYKRQSQQYGFAFFPKL